MSDITLVRHFHATPEQLYRAWVDPTLLTQWFCPNPQLEVEFRGTAAVGSGWEVVMGGRYRVRGRYLVVEPPGLLEFTFQWDHEDQPSVVRVEIDTTDDGTTRLRLTHRDLADEAEAAGHRVGWDLQLNRLVITLA